MSDGTTTEVVNSGESTGDSENQGASKKFTDGDMALAKDAWKKRYLAPVKTKLEAAEQARKEFFETHDVDSFDDIAERLTVQAKSDGDHAEVQRDLKKAQRELVKVTGERDVASTGLAKMVATRNRAAIKDSIYEAAAKADAREQDVYARLVVNNSVAIDDEGVVFVRGTDGEPAHGVTLEQLVTQLVADNKHLQRPTPAQGGGSLPAASGSTASAPDYSNRETRLAALGEAMGGSRRR